jgi:hypothetical protein
MGLGRYLSMHAQPAWGYRFNPQHYKIKNPKRKKEWEKRKTELRKKERKYCNCIIVVGIIFIDVIIKSWDYSPVHFALVILEVVVGVSWTICQSWPWTRILPISASQLARTTDVIHRHLAYCWYYFINAIINYILYIV